MLASTVQFSSYDRDKHPHPSAYPPHQPCSQVRAMGGSTERYQPAATRAPPPPTGEDTTRSDPERTNLPAVPSGPNSVPSRPLPSNDPFPPRTPKGLAY